MRQICVAIDGYAATGKSTTARAVAQMLSYVHVDSGSMYRAAAWYLWQRGVRSLEEIAPEDLEDFELRWERWGSEIVLYVGMRPLREELRQPEISAFSSAVSALPWLRERLVQIQRQLGAEGGIVMDGRDIGTVVLPKAELKVFMQADLEKRVERRYQELISQGFSTSREKVRQELMERDYKDETRLVSPLRKAPDARILDTTYLTIPEQIAVVTRWAESLIYSLSHS